MNDTELIAAVNRSLERQALGAPCANGLLETVKRRSRHRGIRDRLAGVVSGLAAVALIAVVPSLFAQASAGEKFGADQVRVCFRYEGERLAELWIIERVGGEFADTDHTEVDTADASLEHRVAGTEYTTVVAVRPSGALPELDDTRDISVDGRDGLAGTDSDTGKPAAVFDSGVRDGVVTVEITRGKPDVGELADWVESFDVHTTPGSC